MQSEHFRRGRQEDKEFKVIFGYSVSSRAAQDPGDPAPNKKGWKWNLFFFFQIPASVFYCALNGKCLCRLHVVHLSPNRWRCFGGSENFRRWGLIGGKRSLGLCLWRLYQVPRSQAVKTTTNTHIPSCPAQAHDAHQPCGDPPPQSTEKEEILLLLVSRKVPNK